VKYTSLIILQEDQLRILITKQSANNVMLIIGCKNALKMIFIKMWFNYASLEPITLMKTVNKLIITVIVA